MLEPDLHVTLHFLGACAAEPVQRALEAVTGRAFDLELGRLGHFSLPGGRRILFAGVAISEPLSALHADIAAVLAPVGFTPERRAYVPHVTLARLARPAPRSLVDTFEQAGVPPAAARFGCQRFALYASRAEASGARYAELCSYALGAPGRDPGSS